METIFTVALKQRKTIYYNQDLTFKLSKCNEQLYIINIMINYKRIMNHDIHVDLKSED